MIILTVKIKGDTATFSKKLFLPDEYSVSKANLVLQHRVEEIVKEANVGNVDEVNVIARFEW